MSSCSSQTPHQIFSQNTEIKLHLWLILKSTSWLVIRTFSFQIDLQFLLYFTSQCIRNSWWKPFLLQESLQSRFYMPNRSCKQLPAKVERTTSCIIAVKMVRRHFVPRHFVPGHILSRDNMSPGQYVALCPHYFAVQRGDILSQETYCPGSVRRHIVPGDVLSRLATNGKFWQQMVTFGKKW